jgi:hypothetical protein
MPDPQGKGGSKLDNAVDEGLERNELKEVDTLSFPDCSILQAGPEDKACKGDSVSTPFRVR